MKKKWEQLLGQWKNNKITKGITIVVGMVIIVAIGCLLWQNDVEILEEDTPLSGYVGPTVYYEEETAIRGQEIEIDVKASGLLGQYPAASFEITFNKNKLEFVGIRQGNLEISNTKTGEVTIPEWQFHVEKANHTGVINTMYLDMTAEENPIDGTMIAENTDVLFRLVFRVKDSCNAGEKLELNTKQATFAAIDEANSLATYKSNISTPQGILLIQAE